MITTPPTTVAVPLEVLESAVLQLRESRCFATAEEVESYLTPPADLPAGIAGEGAAIARALNPSICSRCSVAIQGSELYVQDLPDAFCSLDCLNAAFVDLPSNLRMPPDFQARVLANPAGALKRQLESWREMDSAPRDGTWILIKFPNGKIEKVAFGNVIEPKWHTEDRGWYFAAPIAVETRLLWRPIVLNPPTKS